MAWSPSGIHLKASALEIPQPSITKISLKITYLKFHSNLPGANEMNCLSSLHGKEGPGASTEASGPISVSDKTSYCKISKSLKPTRLDVKMLTPLWNLAGYSAAPLLNHQPNFCEIEKLETPIPHLQGFSGHYSKKSYMILKWPPVW